MVAADTGLMSGEGVSPAMIGGSTTQRPEEDAMECSGVGKRAATISKQTTKMQSRTRYECCFFYLRRMRWKLAQQVIVSVGRRLPANILL